MLEDVLADPPGADEAATEADPLRHQQHMSAATAQQQDQHQAQQQHQQRPQQQQQQQQGPRKAMSLDEELHRCNQELEGLADLIHGSEEREAVEGESRGSSRAFESDEGSSEEGSWEEVQSSSEQLMWGYGGLDRAQGGQRGTAGAGDRGQDAAGRWPTQADGGAGVRADYGHAPAGVECAEWGTEGDGLSGEVSDAEGSMGVQGVNLEEEELGGFMASRGRVAGEVAETMSPMKAGFKGGHGTVLHAYSGRGGTVL